MTDYKEISNMALELVSRNAKKAFEKICQCLYMNSNNFDNEIEIPFSYFKNEVAKSNDVVNLALDELETLGIVSTTKEKKKRIAYKIDWEELRFAGSVVSKLNFSGRDDLAELIFDVEKKPMSKIDEEKLNEITQDSKYFANNMEYMLRKNFVEDNAQFIKTDPVYSKREQVSSDFYQDCSKFEEKSEKLDNSCEVPCDFETKTLSFSKNPIEIEKIEENDKKSHEVELKEEITTPEVPEEMDDLDYSNDDGHNDDEDEEEYGGLEEIELIDENEGLTDEEIKVKNNQKFREYIAALQDKKKKSGSIDTYKNKPLFHFDELTEFVDSAEACSDSPCKLLLYNIVTSLIDYWHDTHDTGEGAEYPEGYSPSYVDLDNMLIETNDVISLFQNALDDTVGMVQKGVYEGKGFDVEIKFKEMPEIDIAHICEWKQTSDNKYAKNILSTMRNIEAKDIDQIAAVQEINEDLGSVSEPTRSRQFSALLLESKADTLTLIEKLQKKFIETYVLFDKWFYTEGFKTDSGFMDKSTTIVPYHVVERFQSDLFSNNIDKNTFFSTLAVDQKYMPGMPINMSRGVFSYKKTQLLNAKLGYESKLSIKQLDKMKVEIE